MSKIFAGIQIPDKPQEFIPLSNVDMEQNVTYLKQRIATEIKYNDANNLELVFNGRALANNLKLGNVMKQNGIVHCFQRTKQYETYKPSDKLKNPENVAHIQNLFTLIAHIQINVTSRVTIWQKILNEYPEFRRNLGAQAIIRDSVLFNTTHHSETINKIAENYPIICEAAPFIVDTIKKELARCAALVANNQTSESVNESPNSSEEENSLGASSNASLSEGGTTNAQTDSRAIRSITRQQLQNALAQAGIANNTSSVNSLSNIAQRNADSSTTTPLSSSASGDRISAEMFRQEMQRAFAMLPAGNSRSSASASSGNDDAQPMDTTESSTAGVTDDGDEIPAFYRNHEYAEQLRTMSEMGFRNHNDNLTFLNLASGNIENAVNLLMATMNE